MKKSILIFVFFILQSFYTAAQDYIPRVFNNALSYRGLTQNDLTIPIDTIDQPNTNQCRLILPVVYDLMTNSISSFEFMNRVMNYKELELSELIYQLFKDINYYKSSSYENYIFEKDLDKLVKFLAQKIKQSNSDEQKLLDSFLPEEKAFLGNNLLTYFVSSEGEDSSMIDIYKLNETQDTAEANGKKLLDILSKINKEEIYNNSVNDFNFYYGLYQYLLTNKQEIISNNSGKEIYYRYENDGLIILIGGTGNNYYTGRYDLIIDFGGNDIYAPLREEKLSNNFNCIIDLGGNDLYSSQSNYSLGAGVFSSGFIFDYEGDDTYRSSNVNLGAAIGGLGLIFDEKGSDIYEGINFSVGAGMFGAGIVYDSEGNDFYIANSYSQGFGMTEGIGAIIDKKGNDSYLISPVTLDINRYNDHYLSMCQGYGFGLRPYYAGGIGYIIESEGNDVYSCDIFGQGGSYWYSLGVIVDKSGNDKYSGFHYNQGSGIHYSVGLHKDYEGWDYYSSNWVSQGCGHDYALGILWDVYGNDLYSCDGLSQGAGNANGIGILLDENGRDGYLSKDINTQGYGAPSRNFGSIGMCIDASGNDYYSQKGLDSMLVNSSVWGVKLDYYLPEAKQETPPGEFKISVDSNKNYTIDDYYLFARTLEVKFSNYSQFGFAKLVSDSTNTSEYIFKKLGSPDIRDVVLFRNLNSRIGYSISNVIISGLKDYMLNKSLYNTDEVSFMCYLVGEAGNIAAKDILLQLTFDEKYRIRVSAISALAKLNLDEKENGFKNTISDRLINLAEEKNPRKLYNKEIAFAFKKFKNEKNIPALIKMLSYDYYGVRFLAAQDLSEYYDEYYKYLTDEKILEVSSNKIWFQAFLISITNLSNDKFKEVMDKVMETKIVNEQNDINVYIIDILKTKILSTKEKDFIEYLNKLIRKSRAGSNLK